jgi:hypothetical protein
LAIFAFAQLVAAAPFQNGSFEVGSPIPSSTIAFVSDTTWQGVNAGAAIDNVRITQAASDVPLGRAQWTAALFILCAAALLLARRRVKDAG